MAAGKYSFIIEQGATTNFQINWTDSSGDPVDLTGYSARMQVRPSIDSSDIILNLSSSLLDSCGTGIHMSGSNDATPLQSGSIGIYISAASSSLLTFNEAYYDLELVKGCEVYRLLEGKVKLSRNVTR
jgi:type 1 fimbria pilin